ncbi:Major Facilitator Superfamily protein [Blastococcus sp. DSM 46786]|uniref:MFS transporter n=1 Tax=Blastococcus sp. DSM 46786 TaxID=1798227 RepID=UPI0008D4C6A4|nr:MFS transporter [Blastococcus sp. DSM 46786]SEK41216.1 Major Facilitator Superfamily protein [Blastococcus sp. DSM 46786]
MTPPGTIRSATRRLVGLTALRWLPVGLTTPITVLLAQARGLTLGEIGVLFTVHGAVVVALELPTGGLADVLGRRPVVVAGAALHLISCLLFATATSFAGFLVGILALGLGRVLDSGPVEAWYVDTVHRLEPGADVAPGLAKHSAADGASLAVGAVVGGFLPALAGSSGAAGLALPYLGAAVLDVVYVVAVLRLLTEVRPPRQGSARAALGSGLRAVPATVGAAVRLSVTDGPMRVVLLLTGIGGAGLVACELLGPVRFSELAGDRDDGAAVYGVVLAGSFAAAALGAVAAPALRRLLRGSTRAACAVLSLLGGVALATLAGPDLLAVAATGFVLQYLAHGSAWPLLSAVLHTRVAAAHRATAVSAMSLAVALGGIAGNLVIPPLVAAAGLEGAFLAVGVVVALGVLACLQLPRSTSSGAAVVPEEAPVGY